MKIIAIISSNALYLMGHIWSRAVLRFDCMAWTYPVYNNLMTWSLAVNDKYNLDVWSTADK